MNTVVFEDVTCIRGGRIVFDGVSLGLHRGEALIVTGKNGVGKSSLLRIAAGLLKPFTGIVRTTGRVAFMGDASALDDERELEAALRYWGRIDAVGLVADRVVAALDALELGELTHVPVRLLSTGQRRRAAIARVVATQADIWLLDEPANGLDDRAVRELEKVIEHHRANGGVTMIATHLPLRLSETITLRLGDA